MVLEIIFRKRGFVETLLILGKARNQSMPYSYFLEKLVEIGLYYNAFHRSKGDLLKYKLVRFYEGRNSKKIQLTKNGFILYKELNEISEILKKDGKK